MSIFEDVLEVWHNAENRLERERTIKALREAIHKPPYTNPDDMVLIVDWKSAKVIRDKIPSEDVVIPNLGHGGIEYSKYHDNTVRELECTLGEPTMIFAVESGTPFAVALNPEYVNYKNEIMAQNEVYAIDFVQVDE